MGDEAAFDVVEEGDEFEVEEILQYRRNSDGEEYFLVKWVGYPRTECTWEPFRHMNDNCQDLVVKARALYAWKKPAPNAEHAIHPSPVERTEREGLLQQTRVEVVEEIDDDPIEADAPQEALRKSPGPDAVSDLCEDVVDEGPAPGVRRNAAESPPASPAPAKRAKTVSHGLGRPADDTFVPAVVEIRCTCKTKDKTVVPPSERGHFILCKVCSCALHPGCVEEALNAAVPPDFVCPPCRLERVDDFHPPVGPGLLRHSVASASSTFSLDFAAQATMWKKQLWNVHLRAVSLRSGDLGGPAWPHKVTGKLNSRQCVAIDPPKHLHVRREQCYNLTPLLRQGVNYLELRFTPNPERPPNEPEELYCVGVVLTRPRSVPSIITRIRTRSKETESSGQQRIERLLAQINWKEQGEEECMVTGNFGRTLRPMCPVSFCPIEEAAIGRNCNHVQVFDLGAYIAVNQRMRSLDKRWTCPVCSVSLRPDELVLDPFCQSILEQIRGQEDTMDAIVFNEDCSWAAVSAVQEDKEKPGCVEEAAGNASAEMIDLSDSD